MSMLRTALLAAAVLATPLAANAQDSSQIGTLSCDVSKGIGFFVVEKQSLSCKFNRVDGLAETYTGSIDQFGVELGETNEGHLIWGVLAAMWRWGSDWMWEDEDGGPPVVLKDRESGRVVRPVVVDEATGAPLDVRTLRVGRA